jgi:hypothetical protein
MKKLYIPSGLQIGFTKSRETLDYCHYLINLIYEQRTFYKVKGEYVPLKALYLRHIIRNYKEIRNVLIANGIIECDFHYIAHDKSYGYKLAYHFEHMPVIAKDFLTEKVYKRVIAWQNKRIPKTKVHYKLFQFLLKIEIAKEAIDYIACLPLAEYNCALISINKFLEKDFFLHADDYGRVHTNLTSLKSELRQFLRYKGSKLINVDIVNSQPLLIKVVIMCQSRTSNSPYDAHFSANAYNYSVYSALAEGGKLYDFLMEKVGVNDRSLMKEKLFREVFFGRNVAAWFMELFPSVGGFIKDIKKKDYRRLAWIMQRCESDIVIGKICGILVDKFPDVFFSTIHDSIMTTEENVGLVVDLLRNELGKLGINPHIRLDGEVK